MDHKILFFTLIFYVKFCVSKKYENYTLYRAIPEEENHIRFLEELSEEYGAIFWRPVGSLKKPVDILISPEYKEAFLEDAEHNNIYFTTIIEDVQKAFDKQTVETYIRRRTDSFDWRNYFGLQDINNWLHDLQQAYPTEMKLTSIGKTYEGRNIYAAEIALSGSNKKSKVFIEGGIHAREWIAPAFVTYLLYQILTAKQSKNAVLTNIAMSYKWYFVPVVNPDGYEYSHKYDRLWRKNRHNGDEGVDLNRNFEYGFGSVGISFNKLSDTYCGEKALSEPESRALAEYIASNSKGLEFYLAFHAYGQYMILPYAHSKRHLENFDFVRAMGVKAARKIKAKYGTEYIVGTAYDTVGYMTSGVSGCWVKKKFNVPYVLTFELRDSGHHGFALPPEQILPTCLETMDGIITLLSPDTKSMKYNDAGKKNVFHQYDSSHSSFLDKIVMVSNVLLFIIVRFD